MGAEMCRRKPPPDSNSSPKKSLNHVIAKCINQMIPAEKISTKHSLNATHSLSKEDIGEPLNVYTTNSSGWTTEVLTVADPEDKTPIPPPRRRRKHPAISQAISVDSLNQQSQEKHLENVPTSSQQENFQNIYQSESGLKDKIVHLQIKEINIDKDIDNDNEKEDSWSNKEHSLGNIPRNMSREDLEETAQRIKTYMHKCRSFGSFDANQFVSDLCSGRIEVTMGAEDLSDDEVEYLPIKGLAPLEPKSRLTERKISNQDPPEMSAPIEEKMDLNKNKNEPNILKEINTTEAGLTKDNKEDKQEHFSDEDDELETLERFQNYRTLGHRRPSAPRDFPDIVEIHPVGRRESLPVINDNDEILDVVDYGFRGSFSGVSHSTPPPTPVRSGSLDHSNLLYLLKENKNKEEENSSPNSLTPSLNELETAISELLGSSSKQVK